MVITVIGGISLLSGPIIGAIFVIGIPAFLPLDSAGLAATALGQLLIVLYLPAGLGALAEPARDRIIKALGRRAGLDVEAAYAEVATAAGSRDSAVARSHAVPVPAGARLRPPGSVLLRADGLVKSFGGVRAVRGVSLDVKVGETVGLIGPNGAGKTTTFELLGGFTGTDAGRVIFEGRDATGMGPEARGRLGMIRSFQDAALFPTLTVEETVRLSLERLHPTKFFASIAGITSGERQRAQLVRDLLGFMGLNSYRSSQIQALSTGTRRITEIACLVALQPTLLLLDEPSSGVAQKETEALGMLLVELKRQLQLSLLIIEHDIPLIMGLSDRIIAMADGEIIAAGTPQHVRNDPRVVESYLGGDVSAIERSGTVPTPQPEPLPQYEPERVLVGAGGPELFLPGVGQRRTDRLLEAFGDADGVRAASPEQIAALPGFGPGTARRVHEALR